MLGEFAIEDRDDVFRGALRGEQPKPCARLELRQPGFCIGWDVRQDGQPLVGVDQDRLELAGLDLLLQRAATGRQRQQMDLPALDRQHGGRHALERDVGDLQAGLALEPLDPEMGVAADAVRRIVELVGIGLRVLDQLLEIVRRHRATHDHHVIDEGELRHRLEIGLRVVGQGLVHERVEHHARHRQQADRVAVRLRILAGIGADDRVAAGTVLNHDVLRMLLADILGEDAEHHVPRPARRIRHDDLDRLGPEALLRERGCVLRQDGKCHDRAALQKTDQDLEVALHRNLPCGCDGRTNPCTTALYAVGHADGNHNLIARPDPTV